MSRKGLKDGAMGSVGCSGRADGIIKTSPNHKSLSNSAKPTRGDCGPSMANQAVAEVKPPSMPSTSFSMESRGSVDKSDLKQMRVQGSSPLDSSNFGRRYSALQARPKGLQRIARHWLRKTHDASKTKRPVCEKFELEAIDSTVNSSLFDDPPYEKDEISFSDPPSCCGESAAGKYVGMPHNVQQNNSIKCDFGDWPQNTELSAKALHASAYFETNGWDSAENSCFGFCGLCSRRTKRNLNPTQRQSNLGSGDQKLEAFDSSFNSNAECTVQILNCVTRGVGEVRIVSQPRPEVNVGINRGESSTKAEDDEEGEKSYSSSSNSQKMRLDDSYSSGPESEQLRKRLRCLRTKQNVSSLSIHEDDIDDWSAVGTKLPTNQTPKAKNRGQIAQSTRSPPNNHASRPQSLEMDEQFNCCNAYADSLISSRQTRLLRNVTSSLNSQSQEAAHRYCLNSATSNSSNMREDTEFDRPQTYVRPKLNASLPELNGHRDKYSTLHKISSLSSFFDAFPCAEAMWCNPNSNDLKPSVLEKTRNESEALSQRTYVIAKIDLAESYGPRTYSIPSNSHSQVDDTMKNECLKQHNNNATNEAPRKVDFALPGVVQKPSFLSLIKEARDANMLPPSLSTPSYSWEKNEVPENDYMTLPARRPKQQKQQIGEGGKKTTPEHEVKEDVAETKSAMPSPQANQNSTTETKAPSLQSIIETMQKLKNAEMQMKAKKESERIKKISSESEMAITASQAIENAKGTLVVDYKERRRLRQQKELEEARKEVIEATRSALKDRIAFNKKEGHNTSSAAVSKTLFCGSTKAMFDPDASLGDIEKIPEKVEKKEAFELEPVSEESKIKPSPCPIPIADVSKMEVEQVAASRVEESPKELESTPPQRKKTRKKTTKQVYKNRDVNVLPPSKMQIVPIENTLAKPMQSLAVPSQMIVPVPVSMPQCGMVLPFSFPQYSQPNFNYIQNPWEFMEHRCGVQSVRISEASSSGSTSSTRYRCGVRSRPRRREKSSSFSSFSETSSFSSDTTFSTDSKSTESLSSSFTSTSSSSSDQESTSSSSSLSNTSSRASLTTTHTSTSPLETTPRSSDPSSYKD
ncbi:hypothetical protein TcWFU_005518 [Taenia crassiceps]|uniref:Uncharacterized protein n=1 Tax=Taenia crassiceps TaxID=6207 RepID=A0ABR4QHE0_9CEST